MRCRATVLHARKRHMCGPEVLLKEWNGCMFDSECYQWCWWQLRWLVNRQWFTQIRPRRLYCVVYILLLEVLLPITRQSRYCVIINAVYIICLAAWSCMLLLLLYLAGWPAYTYSIPSSRIDYTLSQRRQFPIGPLPWPLTPGVMQKQ